MVGRTWDWKGGREIWGGGIGDGGIGCCEGLVFVSVDVEVAGGFWSGMSGLVLLDFLSFLYGGGGVGVAAISFCIRYGVLASIEWPRKK